MTKASTETYMLKHGFEITDFKRYVDTHRYIDGRRVTLDLRQLPANNEDRELLFHCLEMLGFKQGKRSPNRWTRWEF